MMKIFLPVGLLFVFLQSVFEGKTSRPKVYDKKRYASLYLRTSELFKWNHQGCMTASRV